MSTLRHQGRSFVPSAESGEEGLDFEGVFADGFRDIRDVLRPKQADADVSNCCQDLRCRSRANLGSILGKCDVANPMNTILNPPVAAPPLQQRSGVGKFSGDAGDRILDLCGRLSMFGGRPLDLANLAHPRPAEMVIDHRRRCQASVFDTPVSFVPRFSSLAGLPKLAGHPGGKRPPRSQRRPRFPEVEWAGSP